MDAVGDPLGYLSLSEIHSFSFRTLRAGGGEGAWRDRHGGGGREGGREEKRDRNGGDTTGTAAGYYQEPMI